MAATFDQAVDAYLDNADFEETRSIAKAKAFLTACVRLSVLLPQSASDQGSSQSFDMASVADNKRRAQEFISSWDTSAGAGVRFLSVNTGGFR